MGFVKKIYISLLMVCVSFSVINAKDKKDDGVEESYWDKVTDMVPTKKIDTILHDISEDVDIDDKEESLIDNIKDSLPDIISKPATYAVQSGSDSSAKSRRLLPGHFASCRYLCGGRECGVRWGPGGTCGDLNLDKIYKFSSLSPIYLQKNRYISTQC